jgi:hypothetical protein
MIMPFSRMMIFLSAVIAVTCTLAVAEEDGFKPIFNGKNLDGWDGNPKFWRVEDGTIVGETTAAQPAGGNTFLVWRGGQPADFELKAEFRMPNAGSFANSGIQYRSREEASWGRWVIGGYQADMNDTDQYTGILYEERGRGILAIRGQKVVIGENHKPQVVETFGDPTVLQKKINKNGWNAYHILAKGNHLVQIVNGQVMVDITDNDLQQRRSQGLLALQLHAGPPMKVQFRDILLKELPPTKP